MSFFLLIQFGVCASISISDIEVDEDATNCTLALASNTPEMNMSCVLCLLPSPSGSNLSLGCILEWIRKKHPFMQKTVSKSFVSRQYINAALNKCDKISIS